MFLPEEGCEWGCFDYSQQEPRLVLHFAAKTGLSGVGNTLEKYKTGSIDFHSEIAEITGLERKAAKTISLGLFYGMGKAKLQAQLGINDEMEAKRIL